MAGPGLSGDGFLGPAEKPFSGDAAIPRAFIAASFKA
jgi:hypothetical protein